MVLDLYLTTHHSNTCVNKILITINYPSTLCYEVLPFYEIRVHRIEGLAFLDSTNTLPTVAVVVVVVWVHVHSHLHTRFNCYWRVYLTSMIVHLVDAMCGVDHVLWAWSYLPIITINLKKNIMKFYKNYNHHNCSLSVPFKFMKYE